MMEKKVEVRPGLDIAVIGMSGRFPHARNLEEFWTNLKNGKNSVTFFTDEELMGSGVDPELLKAPNYVKANVILEDIENFDAAFFDYPPVEAEAIDPQMRLFHECVWEALEDAGYNPDTYEGLIGLYSGAKSNAYWAALSMLSGKNETLGYFAATQYSNKDSQSTLVSYKLNLRGPSFTLQTACSTSLVAIHLGCQALLNGECDIALAGGANINMPQNTGYLFQEGMLYSSDGYCRTFDARADGSIFGSGAGVVALKRIEDAIADRDNIYAVIKGSAINNDGNRKPGFIAPSVDGQKDAISAAHLIAGVEPESIGYVETHGTATTLGDPVEFEGLKQAFNTSEKAFCGLGSVKTNIGHLDAAAGVAGFIKTVLAIRNKQIPPTLHFERPSPKIDFIDSPFYINTELRDWSSKKYPLRAGVSTFGVGGTNAHIVLEEAPLKDIPAEDESWKIICLSAKTRTALDRMTENLAAYLSKYPSVSLADVAYTLKLGRKAFNQRRVFVCRNMETAIQKMRNTESIDVFSSGISKKEPAVACFFPDDAFAFAKANTCSDLYHGQAVFRASMDKCFDTLKALTGTDIKKVFYPAPGNTREKTILEMPGLNDSIAFMLEYATVKLLMHWGIKFSAIGGDMKGELVAACMSEVISVQDALKLLNILNKLDVTMDDLEKAVKVISFQRPATNYFSSLNAKWTNNGEVTDPSYWIKRIQTASDFPKIAKELSKEHVSLFLKIGSEGGETVLSGIQELTVLHDHANGDDMMKNLYHAMGQLWCMGVRIDWRSFYEGKSCNRVSLPTYPFERKRYWLKDNLKENDIAFAAQTMAGLNASFLDKELKDWFYIPSWKRSKINEPPFSEAVKRYRWLIFIDDTGIGEGLIRELKPFTTDIIQVKEGQAFDNPEESCYTINPGNTDDYKSLFKDLSFTNDKPLRILHLWNISNRKSRNFSIASFDHSQELGLYSLLNIIRESDIKKLNDIRLQVITNAIHDVTGAEKLSPEQSTLIAALKVIPQEYAGLLCKSIDITRPEPNSSQEKRLLKQLLEEVSAETLETIVAYRNGYRWVETFEPFQLSEDWESKQVLRQNGTYLITGGLGSLGLILSEYLARTVKANIILTSRSPFPPKEDWDNWLTKNGHTDPVSSKIRAIRSIENEGGTVLIVQADAADKKQMKQLVTKILKQFGQLNGVIHSAGIVDGKTFTALSEISRDDIRQHFQSKVYGLVALEKALQPVEHLDFCVLMSSMAAVLGGLGHVAYAAANIFMDAYINEHNKVSKQRWLCVNWETIRTVKEKDDFNTLPQLGVNEIFITPQQMLTGFQRILAWSDNDQAANRIIFATGDLEVRMDRWIRFKTPEEPGKNNLNTTVYERPELSTTYVAPRLPIEIRLADIWQKFFSVGQIGIEDNFFELGGDSLKAIMIIEKMYKEVNAKIPIAEFFKTPTIQGIAGYFSDSQEGNFTAVESVKDKDYYNLSPGQKSMYLVDELYQHTANNGLFVNKVKGKLDKDLVEQTFNKLIERHESLRTSFESVEDMPYQKIHDRVSFSIEYNEALPHEVDRIVEKFVRPFDLKHAPLLRVGVTRIDDSNAIFMMDMHHLIADPVSEEILLKEFMTLYKGGELPPLTTHYKDFVAWHEKLSDSDEMRKQEAFWLNEFNDNIPVLNLPADFERPDYLNFEGDEIKLLIGKEELQALKKLAKSEGLTLYMLLLAMYNVFLSKISGQEDIVIGSPIAGRKHADFENVIGMFLNMLPIRTRPEKEKTFREYVQEVKEKVIQSFEHQDYPLEYLVDKVVKVRDLSRNPLFDTTFTLLQSAHFNKVEVSREIGELAFAAYKIPEKSVKFDLVLQAEEFEDLQLTFYYRSKLFTADTMKEFVTYYKKTLWYILENPSIRLKDIKLIDDLAASPNILLEESGDFNF